MGAGEEQAEFFDTPIVKIVEDSDVSVRLTNAIRLAQGHLPLRTIGEYLAAGPNASEKFLSLQNLGRKSARELDALLRSFAETGIPLQPNPRSVPQPSEIVHIRLREKLLRMFSKLSFPEIAAEFPTSARLAHVFREKLIESRPFSEFLRNPEPTFEALLKLHNVGRRSVAELQASIRQILEKLLRTRTESCDEIESAISLLLDKTPPSPENMIRLSELVTSSPYCTEDITPTRPETSLNDIVLELLRQLDDRTKLVLERRYGVNQLQGETLEEVAGTWGITRERVRQIESKGLRQLCLPSRLRSLKRALNREAASLISTAASGVGAILDSERSTLMKRLTPSTRLAIDAVYYSAARGSIDQTFLKQHCKKWKNGWLLADQSSTELNQILVLVKTRLQQRVLPVTLNELLEGIDRSLGTVAINLGTSATVFEGYVIDGRIGPRRRRTVRLHARLSVAGGMQEISALLSQYHKAFTNDPCSVRDAEIVMTDAPHLFLRIVDENWHAVGPAGIPVDSDHAHTSGEVAENASEELIGADEEANIRGILRKELAENGPQRFVDLRARCASHLGEKSIHSLGPILLTSGNFVRPLPGIYALREQLPSAAVLPFDPPKFLLSEEQARWLAMARHSSEPFGLFPLWSPAAEYALCRWAQAHATRSVYRSLLAVSSIVEWPVSEETREQWLSFQRREGMYELEFEPRYSLSHIWPGLDRVLAATVFLESRGGISWISANRILKRRLDASVSAGLLALMVLGGALKPPDHWQGLHEPGPNLQRFHEELSRELHRTGALNWESSAGRAFIDKLHAGYRSHLGGWVTETRAQEFFAAADDERLPMVTASMDEDEPMNALEALLQEHRKRSEKNLIDSTLATLKG